MSSDSEKADRRRVLATQIASPFASMVAKFVMHPIDTLKSKVQVNRVAMRSVTDFKAVSALNIAKSTWKNEGISGFFRGVTISVIGSAFAFGFYMSTYQRAKTYLSNNYKVNIGLLQFFSDYTVTTHFISGFIAEIVSCSLWLPIDIVKERMQVQSEVKIYTYKSPIEAIKKIRTSEGLIGLYRAFGATLLFFGPYSALFFATFEKLKELIVKDKQAQTFNESLACSSIAGAFAGFMTTPLEIVKLRMQIQRADVAETGGKLENSVFGYRNAFHGLKQMLVKEGFLALFKGGFLRICFSMPTVAISMTLTEEFKKLVLQRKELLDTYI